MDECGGGERLKRAKLEEDRLGIKRSLYIVREGEGW